MTVFNNYSTKTWKSICYEIYKWIYFFFTLTQTAYDSWLIFVTYEDLPIDKLTINVAYQIQFAVGLVKFFFM